MFTRWFRKPAPVLAALFALSALVAAGGASVNLAFSGEGTGIVSPGEITPLAFTGYPTDVAKAPRELDQIATCQAPTEELDEAGATRLSCRYSGAEPPTGSIETPSPSEIPGDSTVATAVPNDWTVVNNKLFRFALAIPPGWTSDMRAEGGQFSLFDAVQSAKVSAKGVTGLTGGIAAYFSAREIVTQPVMGRLPDAEERLAVPNLKLGDTPAVVWEEPGGEGTAVTIRVAFSKAGILYEAYFDVVDDGRPWADIVSDAELCKQIIATIMPY
jgi:hypothetical protein